MGRFSEDETCNSKPVGTKKQLVVYIVINIIIGIGIYQVLHNMQQTLAATIFIALVIGTLIFWRIRVAIAFIGIVILLITGTIDLPTTIEFMSLDVIIFLIGMMIIVGLLRRSGFFHWLMIKSIKLVKSRVYLLMTVILVMACLMAAFVDEVTSILFMSAMVLDLCDYYSINPVNYIISVVLATNIGSSWTVLGNPVGIMIALRSGLTFEDFIYTAMPVGVLALISLIIILLIWQRGDLKKLEEKIKLDDKILNTSSQDYSTLMSELSQVKDKKLFNGSAIIFVMVIIFLVFNSRLEIVLGLKANTLLVAISIAGAGVAMLWQRHLAREILMKDVDWWTLIFFMFLFAKVGSLKYVGLTDLASNTLMGIGEGNLLILIPLILIFSGLISSVLDNVLVVAMFAPIIQSMTVSLGTTTLWWALLFGSCYGGNITMVGSTANIVSLGILEDRKGCQITLRYWLKIGLIAGLIPMVIATIAMLFIFL